MSGQSQSVHSAQPAPDPRVGAAIVPLGRRVEEPGVGGATALPDRSASQSRFRA